MTSWVAPGHEAAAHDFWVVYDANFEAVLGELVRVAPERRASITAGARDRLRRAMAGDWDAYEEFMRGQAVASARQGMAFETWQQLVVGVHLALIPYLVTAYTAEPPRLAAALVAMQHFGGRALTVLSGAFLLERDTMGGELQAEARRARDHAEALAEHHRTLRAADAVFRILVDSVTDYAIFVLDPDGCVATWNRGAERLKGYAAADIVGRHHSIFYTAEDRATGVAEALLASAAADGRAAGEGWRVRRDHTRFWASVTITAMRDEADALIGFAKVTRDLTAWRAAERALSEANGELEAFSYSVAHDLRAPLRGMSGFAQLVVDKYRASLDAEGVDWLEEIVLSAKNMGELIDGLLQLGRASRGAIRSEQIDLSLLAENVLARLARAEPSRVVDVVIARDLQVEMDPRLARALLDNLLGNAWKFSSRSPHARIELGVRSGPEGRSFFVRDDGVGFDMAYAKKLFAPFQRLHSGDEFAGTGIGLATAQRIVRRHGGRIWAEAAVGRGATFHFTVAEPPSAPTS